MTQILVDAFDSLIADVESNDVVFISVGINDPVEEWAKKFRYILDLPLDRRPCIFALGFHGFEEDDRELFEIDEVRNWAKKFVDHDLGAVRALVDEMHTVQRFGRFGYQTVAQAIGRAKLLALAGQGDHIWKNETSRADGYAIAMHQSAVEILAGFETADRAEKRVLSNLRNTDVN